MTGPWRVEYDMPAVAYHADPALSQSDATLLLDAPARLAHARAAGRDQPTRSMTLGSALHDAVLGDWTSIIRTGADYKTAAARATRDGALAAGCYPVTDGEFERVEGMVDALAGNPVAHALLTQPGHDEVSLFAQDQDTGVWLRCRPDRLPEPTRGGRTLMPDLKTAKDASPRGFARACATYSYHLQAAWYLRLAVDCGLASEDAAFLFVVVESEPPHLVATYTLEPEDIAHGRRLMDRAVRLYAECETYNSWPGYPSGPTPLALPGWKRRELEDEEYADAG